MYVVNERKKLNSILIADNFVAGLNVALYTSNR